eukprot:m.82539 g.82539  ORF g.82539 m.82539 type:complete len:499 (+) comp8266_c0_seq2:259-1755(+)
MEFLTEQLPSWLTGATFLPMIQDLWQHRREVQTAIELHREAIVQAETQHAHGIKHANELHEKEQQTARALHRDAKRTGHQLHDEQIRLANELHDVETKLARELHNLQTKLALKLHIENLWQQLRHHTQQVKISIESARRENLRDVWIQKNRKADTLLITTTLMFASFVAIAVEGTLDERTPEGIVIVYAIALTCSFLFLLICMWFTMRYQSRMADYNIYDKHETYNCGRTHRTFESFYECHCVRLARLANTSFYIGTLSLVVGAAALLYSKFNYTFQSRPSALIYVVGTIVGIISLTMLPRLYPSQTRPSRKPDDKDHLHYILKEVEPTPEELSRAGLRGDSSLSFYFPDTVGGPASSVPEGFDSGQLAGFMSVPTPRSSPATRRRKGRRKATKSRGATSTLPEEAETTAPTSVTSIGSAGSSAAPFGPGVISSSEMTTLSPMHAESARVRVSPHLFDGLDQRPRIADGASSPSHSASSSSLFESDTDDDDVFLEVEV